MEHRNPEHSGHSTRVYAASVIVTEATNVRTVPVTLMMQDAPW